MPIGGAGLDTVPDLVWSRGAMLDAIPLRISAR
jgi:hypothetical protein